MTTEFGFTLHGTDGIARLGTVHTLHGDIRTPAFMPVGTVGTVKGLYLDQVEGTGADIILGNTYHLMLRPGAERVHRLGGLHRFMRWTFTGTSDVPIALSLACTVAFEVLCVAVIAYIFKTGWRLRD